MHTPLMLLCTGTLVVLANQVVSNQAATSPSAQLLTLVRYSFTFAQSALLYAHTAKAPAAPAASRAPRAPPLPPRTRALLVGLGLLDVSCYAIYLQGFALCGAALATVVLAASGQIATAALSVLVLRRRLRPRHIAAVAIVTAGLVLRSLDDVLATTTNTSSSSSSSKSGGGSSAQLTYGVLCVVLSALMFSVLGCLYELLMSPDAAGTAPVSQAQASFTITGVSLAASLAHLLLYTLPNWQALVLQPLAASQASLASVVGAHAAYGLLTAAHHYVQLRLLASHGAMAVGLVNAVRASVVSFVSSWLFCGAVPHLCLTHARALSALVVSLGAAQWVLAGKPVRGPAAGGEEAGAGMSKRKGE